MSPDACVGHATSRSTPTALRTDVVAWNVGGVVATVPVAASVKSAMVCDSEPDRSDSGCRAHARIGIDGPMPERLGAVGPELLSHVGRIAPVLVEDRAAGAGRVGRVPVVGGRESDNSQTATD